MSQNHDSRPEETGNKGINYKTVKTFLENYILTVLSFMLLVGVGISSIFLLKTVGFPNPEVKFAVVNTLYQGASSQTVAQEVTQPLENTIKDVEGVESFSSTSRNSVSTINVTIEADANVDTVKNKLTSSVQSADLPDDVSDPEVISPDISGPSTIYAISGENREEIYNTYKEIETKVNQIPETSEIAAISKLEKVVVITFDSQALSQRGLSAEDVTASIETIGESLPVTSDVLIEDGSKSIVTSLEENGLDRLRELRILPSSAGQGQALSQPGQDQQQSLPPTLDELAELSIEYRFENESLNKIAINRNGDSRVNESLNITVKAVEGTALGQYNQEVEEIIDNVEGATLYKLSEDFDLQEQGVIVSEVYSVNSQNSEQVDEVITGLVGGPLEIDNQLLAQLGWLFGGIQLVFLVMLAFVSFRAAIISTLAIPLSLFFSTIYILAIGEDLNTLVLFSLVLVIGLVVDPALVVLESIQRKKDAGFKGNQAALEAVKDVGGGVFLAALTNIIVFAPFAVLSGVLGQIFSYIPLTIIPAIIGSYIVPLIFLSWLGSLFLKRNKKAKDSEEENLWRVSKWLMKLNTFVLKSNPLIRLVIIILGIVIPFGVMFAYTSTGQVRVVQFSSSDDPEFMTFQGSFSPSLTSDQQGEVVRDSLELIASKESVAEVYPFQGGNGIFYYVNLKEGRTVKSTDLAVDLTNEIRENFGEDYFDVEVSAAGVGPQESLYQAQISIRSEDLDKIRELSLDIRERFIDLCVKEANQVSFDENCSEDDKLVVKVDDGYTDKESETVEILLDREALIREQLIIPGLPFATGLVNQQVSSLYELGNERQSPEVSVDGEDVKVLYEQDVDSPDSIEEIKQIQVRSTTGQTFALEEIAEVRTISPRANIERVDGQTVGTVRAMFMSDFQGNQALAGQATQLVQNYYTDNDGEKIKEFGLEADDIGQFNEGAVAEFQQTFTELIIALLLAIFVSYFVLALFFNSFTQPLNILYTVPLTFVGVFPALAYLAGGQIGFLEIIGIIILIGIVENVAIFLIDSARQKMAEGWDEEKAIIYASGIRLRPVLLTSLTAMASLLPLAIFSEFYRSISIVIIAGTISSGVVSLVTTPILFIFFIRSARAIFGTIRKAKERALRRKAE
jgi:hydrophobic/amphiphilic exporter-1 (mainly G- bacteria), HAE1 family